MFAVSKWDLRGGNVRGGSTKIIPKKKLSYVRRYNVDWGMWKGWISRINRGF